MNFGLRKMQISSAAVPPKRIRPIQRLPAGPAARPSAAARVHARRRARARARAAPAHPLQADAARALHEHRVARRAAALASSSAAALRVGHGVALAGERAAPSPRPAGRRSRAPRRRAASRARRSRGAGAALVGPELEHVAEHRHAPPGRGLGEVVDRGAHGHRVGVVAVVDQHDPVRQRDPLAAQRREAHINLALGVTPSARAAATAASRLRRLCACANDGRRLDARLARRAAITTLAVLACARASSTSPPSPNVTVRRSARRCGSSSGSPAGHDRGGAGRQARDQLRLGGRDRLERAQQLEVHRADVDDHADVGLGDRASAPRSARRRASPSPAPAPRVPAGAASIASGSPISVLRFSGLRHRAQLSARAAPRGCPSSRSSVEPVIATTFAPRARARAARRARAPAAPRADRRARAPRLRRCPRPSAAMAATAARARARPAPPTRPPAAPAPRTRRRRRARRAGRRTARPAPPRASRCSRARVRSRPMAPADRRSVAVSRGPPARPAPSRGRRTNARPGGARDSPTSQSLTCLSRRPRSERSAPRAATVDVVERQLAPVRELLALLVALAGDHHHVARLRQRDRPLDRRPAIDLDVRPRAVARATRASAAIAARRSRR